MGRHIRENLGWYARRAASMSVSEVGHRIHEQIVRQNGRRVNQEDWYNPEAGLPAIAISDEKFNQIAGKCLEEWRAETERVRTGRWCFFGQEWAPVSLANLWHYDPVNGEAWERDIYCFDVPYRHRADRGDIKYTWEVNRLQFLPIIAALYRAEGRVEDRELTLRLIESWIDENPVFYGVNWASGIEIALRAVSITLAISLLDAERIPTSLQHKISRSLQAHFYWLGRYPSRFSSANNHRIAELAAAYFLGRLMPAIPGANPAAALAELNEEMLRQITEDGVGAEQSPSYTCFTIEWYLLIRSVAETVGDTVDARVSERLRAAARHLRWMMDADGNVPRIGDDDEGRVIISGTDEKDYVTQILASLAKCCPEFAPPSARAHLRQVWMGAQSGGKAPQGAAFFDVGGYSVLRHKIAGRQSMIAMDHGPLGYLSIAAHGHADALAVWWHVDGQPVFVDAGTYLYHSGGTWRDKFRGTAVHNTLCLAGQNQSKIAGPFNWSRRATATRIPMARTTGGLCIEAEQDGYLRDIGVRHRRKLALDVPNGYLIQDRLIGRASSVEGMLTYVLHPDIAVHLTANGALELSHAGRKFARISLEGYAFSLEKIPYSAQFGERQTTTALRAIIPASGLLGQGVETRINLCD
ncbi:heparinase II/III family protein (plasmid) [Falsihalocynthiibacter sp. SS001]|uniref:heparinase II/III domain-containing protein n=1 Tax=Falsihalocynthiibacter sp. SS001 TaxID=3349698 RepID=UPI0036D3B7A2